MLTVPPFFAPSSGAAGPFESSAVPTEIEVALTGALEAPAPPLLPSLLLWPLEHAVVTARAPATRTAAASRILRELIFILPGCSCAEIFVGVPGAWLSRPPESLGPVSGWSSGRTRPGR